MTLFHTLHMAIWGAAAAVAISMTSCNRSATGTPADSDADDTQPPSSTAAVAPETDAPVTIAAPSMPVPTTTEKRIQISMEGAEPGKWTMDWDAAQKAAAEHHLPMLLFFTGSDWCPACKMFEAEVLTHSDWHSLVADRFILVVLDFPRQSSLPAAITARNEKLSEKWQIQQFPTFIVLDEDGSTRIGKVDAVRRLYLFEEALHKLERYSSRNVNRRVQSLPTEKADQYRQAVQAWLTADAELNNWLATNPALNDDNVEKLHQFEDAISVSKATITALEVELDTATFEVEVAEKYRQLHGQLAQVQAELATWLKTRPPRNDESEAKYASFRERFSPLQAEIEQISIDQQAKSMTDANRVIFLQLHADKRKLEAEKEAFFKTRPARNAETMAMVDAFMQREETIRRQLIRFREN